MDRFPFHCASFPICWESATLFIHTDDNAQSSLTPSTKSIFLSGLCSAKAAVCHLKPNPPRWIYFLYWDHCKLETVGKSVWTKLEWSAHLIKSHWSVHFLFFHQRKETCSVFLASHSVKENNALFTRKMKRISAVLIPNVATRMDSSLTIACGNHVLRAEQQKNRACLHIAYLVPRKDSNVFGSPVSLGNNNCNIMF